MILTPDEAERYPEIIKQIKRSFVHNLPETLKKQARLELTSSQYRRGEAGIWQSRYYEHAIRNEKDMEEKMLYLRDNPVKHGLCECTEDWPYSSFNR
jgi:putative transposase